eukprot:355738_1
MEGTNLQPLPNNDNKRWSQKLSKPQNPWTQKISKRYVIKQWMQQVSGDSYGNNIFDDIQDGVKLCNLLNTIKPGTCKRFKIPKNNFQQRVNVQIFLEGCKKLSVPQRYLFETRDLTDKLNLNQVSSCLFALKDQTSTLE